MGVRRCIVKNCGNKSDNKLKDVRYHKLPSDKEVCKLWMEWILKENNVSKCDVSLGSIFICSNHFRPEDRGTFKLKSRAIPCVSVERASRTSANAANLLGVDERVLITSDNVSKFAVEELVVPAASASVYSSITTIDSLGCNPISITRNETQFNCGEIRVHSTNLFPEVTSVSEIFVGSDFGWRQTEYTSVIEVDTQTFVNDVTVDLISDLGQESIAIAPNLSNNSDVNDVLLGVPESTGVEVNSSNSIEVNDGWIEAEESIAVEINPSINTVTNLDIGDSSCKRRKCAVANCSMATNVFFTFPAISSAGKLNMSNVIRCKEWVKKCGNVKLLKVPTVTLHKNYFIHSGHFATNQFYNERRKRLLPSAVPSIDLPCELLQSDIEKFPILRPQDVINENEENGWLNEEMFFENSELYFDKHQKKFEQIMHSMEWRNCKSCKEAFFVKKSSQFKCLHGKNCHLYSNENDMDPGTVPEELLGLSYIEEQLIAKVHPVVSVFKLKGLQYGYRGNIVNFPQNVRQFARKLPHRISDLSSVLTIRVGEEDVSFVDFHVRADRVRNALLWLQENNPYYADVEISVENLDSLPEDGYVYNSVSGFEMTESDCVSTNNDENMNEISNENGVNVDDIYESCVPMLGSVSEEAQLENILGWSAIGDEKINEFVTVGYVAQAFPALFPYGVADLRAPRGNTISEVNYFRHLMRFHDRRFAQHPRFRFFAYNSMIRWRALRNGGMFVNRNEEFSNMSLQTLREKLQENPNLIKKIMFQNSNIPGTRPFWFSRGKDLTAMIEQLNLPTVFFTLSSADLHWPDLFKILSPDKDLASLTEAERRKLLQDNPLIVDSFFALRVKTYLMEVFKKKYKIKDSWYRVEYQPGCTGPYPSWTLPLVFLN